MKIYTKNGDKGMTSGFGGDPFSKSDQLLEAYGTVDELNCQIGLCFHHKENLPDKVLQGIHQKLTQIQNRLFTVGSHLALRDGSLLKHLPPLDESWVLNLEKEMDEHSAILPELKSFILPGGHPLSSQLHVCRAVCRRAERQFFRAISETSPQKDLIGRYLNRLSDYFFSLARLCNHHAGQPDQIWIKD